MTVAELKMQEVPKTTSVFHHILVAVDFSEASRRALRLAAPLATDDAHLSALHVRNVDWRYEVLDTPELELERSDARYRLEAMVREFGAPQKIQTILLKHWAVSQTILSTLAKEDADLLVIGTRGRGGLQKLALGSVAEELMRLAPCPVMTIGPKVDLSAHSAGIEFRTILFATDFGKGSTKALPIVLELARQHNSKLIVQHMLAPMPMTSTSLSAYAPASAAADEFQEWEGSSRNRSLQQLRDWMPRDTGLAQDPEYVVGTDFSPEGILTAAINVNADLIVMGANHKGSARFAAHIPWTAVHEVVRNAPCPVLTVAG